MECVDLCIQLSIRQSVARCPPERSGGWAPTISPGAQPILPLTSLQFCVATDFTSEWSRTWSQPADSRGRLEFYSGTVVPLTSLQFYVATDFTSEWNRTWSQPADSRGRLEFYSGTVMPPPPGHHHQLKEGHLTISAGSEVAWSSTVGTVILHSPCHHQFSAFDSIHLQWRTGPIEIGSIANWLVLATR